MPEFSPRRRAEPTKAKTQPDSKKNDPKKDPTKNIILQRLQKMYGSKGSFEALMKGKFDVTKAAKEAAGPELMAKVLPPANPIVAEGLRIFLEQLTSYHQFVGAYSDYVEQIRRHSAYGLFWKYQESFKNFGSNLVKEILMRGLEDIDKLIAEEMPAGDQRNELTKALQEVQTELKGRENGEDLQDVHKKVSSQTDITKTKDGAMLEKTISADVSLNTPPDEFIKTFLKNNGILIETLEKRVKEQVDKKRSELTDKPIETSSDASPDSTADTSPTPLSAAAVSNKP